MGVGCLARLMALLPGEDLFLKALRRRAQPRRVEVGPGKRFVIYGAGNFGNRIRAVLREAGAEVAAFIDRREFPDGKLDGTPVWHPESAELGARADGTDGVVIGVFNHGANLRDIYALLRSRTRAPVYLAADLARALPKGALQVEYWLDILEEPAKPEEIAPRLAHVYGLLADEKSRELLLELVNLRASFDYEAGYKLLHEPDLEHQYFPTDLPVPIDTRRMIDCGAFDGDTLAVALQQPAGVERVACFEPEPRNYRKLVARVDALATDAEIELFPLAAWHEMAVLSFDSDRGGSSSLASLAGNAGKVHVQAVALHDALRDFRPTLLKMDIESAELSALRGAEKLLKKDRPQLAICLYHRLDHYYLLPEFVEALGCGYRIYLRQHGFNGMETVMYALAG